MKTVTSAPAEIEYPSADGKPMAESDLHRDWMVEIISRLKRFFAGQRVYVSGNLLIYYVEGNPKKSFAPDAFVVKNCDPGRREIYKLWEEKRTPNFMMETTSKKTRSQDKGPKMRLYAELKVPEYFLHDPRGEWLKPPLRGYRLRDGDYVPIEPDADGGLRSEELGITFKLEDGQLVMFETATGKKILSDSEFAAEAKALLAREAAERKRLEQELARLKKKT